MSADETGIVITNIQKILAGAGATLADVVKCSVF
jgi:enamine deaminase RidA (YjgF/YER057c/UK114 family)